MTRQPPVRTRTTNRNPLQVYQDQPTRSNAIKARCYQCVGEGQDSGWREAIRQCSVDSCALHDYRPYQKKGSE